VITDDPPTRIEGDADGLASITLRRDALGTSGDRWRAPQSPVSGNHRRDHEDHQAGTGEDPVREDHADNDRADGDAGRDRMPSPEPGGEQHRRDDREPRGVFGKVVSRGEAGPEWSELAGLFDYSYHLKYIDTAVELPC